MVIKEGRKGIVKATLHKGAATKMLMDGLWLAVSSSRFISTYYRMFVECA